MTHKGSEKDVDDIDDVHADLVDLLRRIDRATAVPPHAADRELALLTAFDATRERPRPVNSAGRSRWVALAATIVLVGGAAATWLGITGGPASAPPPDTAEVVAAAEPTDSEFVPWPGASALPRLESGQLVRMDLPASMLPSLGFFPPASDTTVVRADVLIGQDGLARAVRLAP